MDIDREDAAAVESVWDDDSFCPADPVERVREVSGLLAMFAAQRFERVDALRRDALADAVPFRGGVAEIVERSLRLELAAALQITEFAADRLLVTAEALVARYPRMLDALHRGATTERHAEVFVELVDPVEAGLRDQVVAIGVELAQVHPLGTFRRRLRSLVDTVRAATLEERHRDALAQRRVVIEPAADGMAWLLVHLPEVEARAIHTRLTGIAKTLAGDDAETRTLDQLRADAAGDLLVDGVVPGHPEAAHGVRATVTVTVPALTLLDDDHAAEAGPAVVEGVGPIPLSRARELCGAADGWMRVLTHPETGVVLSVGRDQYRPPAALARMVRWRAQRCLAPGCGIPADRCHLDHQVAWADGGRTELSNLAPLCTGHHTIKHHGGWRVRQLDTGDGTLEWTSPLGRTYLAHPERRLPAFHPT